MYMESTALWKNGEYKKILFQWDSCVAAGYTSRDQSGVHAHIEELRNIGVPAPERVPSMYWLEPNCVISSAILWVVGDFTSGEGEVFLAKCDKGDLYVTVASDHTDRALEAISVAKAKQICSKVVSPVFWRVSDIREHWDEIELRTWVDGKLYQEGSLGMILPPEKLFELAHDDAPSCVEKLALFSGTLPVLGKELIYGTHYTLSLKDSVLGREIRHKYSIHILPDRN